MIAKMPITLVKGDQAQCDGGGGGLGHPIEFIQLNDGGAKECKYCGLEYQKDPDYHGHGH